MTTAMKHKGLPGYDEGYADGREAIGKALQAYAKKIGFKPSVLRSDVQDRERRFASGERLCIGCGTETSDTFGGLCIDCDVKEATRRKRRAGP